MVCPKGRAHSLIPIANRYTTIKFIVEDIDSGTYNIKNLTKRINKLGNKRSIEKFNIVYGKETFTNLLTASFPKVLMFMAMQLNNI